MARKPRHPPEAQPDLTPSPPPPTGWMNRSDDGEEMRAAQAALSSGSQYVPAPPPQQPPTGWMPHPADDGLVARTYADRQNKLNPTILGPPLSFASSSPEPPGWVGQPQAMPKTLLGSALEAPSNSDPAAQPMTFVNDKGDPVTFLNNDGQPVTFVNDKGAPLDEFAEAASEAALNPDPAVEREIFDYGKKDTEPPSDGVAPEEVRARDTTGANRKAKVRARGRGRSAQRKSPNVAW